MNPTSSLQPRSLLLPILVGGFTAGLLDLILAFYTFGRRMPLGIASGLLGSHAFQGGTGIWLLGIVLHFVIAFSAAAIYCLSSLRLTFLGDHFFVCGLYYGIAVYLVMNLVVLPLSAVPFKVGPFSVSQLIHGLVPHMLIIGLPIAFSLWFFARTSRRTQAT